MLLTAELDRLSATDWQPFFAQERAKPYFAELDAFVTAAAAEKTVYPAPENIFAAFRACPASSVRVVILGQDPYHEPGQAMGLSFSVPDGCKAPPSLRNIFKEFSANFFSAKLLLFPSVFSKKSNNDNSPHPLHFGLPVCFFIVFLACSYNCFLSGATSDRYSARKPRTCLEIYSDSVLFVVVAARRASSLISLTNSVCVFELFPFVGI